MRFMSLFCLGGTGYVLLEFIWRGRSHYSMFAAGGVCFLFLIWLSGLRSPFLLKCLLAGAAITGVEFITGCVVNLWLGLRVWDYSSQAGHLLGQVCPVYLLLWCVLSAAILLSIGGVRTLLARNV